MAEQQNPVISDSDVQRILSTIKQVESSGNYEAKAKGSSASGAYQFINDTWQRSTKRYGIGTEYKTAADAPPDVQDAVAAMAVKDILGQVGGDVTKVPLVWYTGNPQGRMTAEALKANQGLTPDKYQQKWMSVFNQGRPAATAQAQAPAQAPRTPVQGTQVAAAAKPSLTDMPPAYRMALAANYLADTESPETSVVERAMEMLNEQQGGAAKNPLAGYMQAMGQESVNPFQFVQQPEEEERRRPVPRMPMRMAEGGPVYGVETNPELSIKNLQTLVSEGQGSESAAPTGPAASGYGVMADIGNSLVGLSESVPGMATAALGMVGQAMVNHALAPFAEALSNEAVATAQANAASAVSQGLASEAEAAGIGPGVGPGIAAPADAAESSDAAAASDGPGADGADGADGDGFKHGGLVNKGVVPRMPKKFQEGGEVSDDEITLRRSTAVLNQQFNRDLEDVRAGRQDLSALKRYFPNYDVNQIGMMVLPTDSGGPVLIPRDIVPPPSDTRELLFRPNIGRHQQLKGLNELITGIDSPQREDLLRNDEYMARFTNPSIREGDIRFPRDQVHKRGLRLEKGGEVSSEMSDEERSRDRERELRQAESRMSYALGPMDIRAIRKPEGYQARVSSSFNQVVPYMDFDPLTGTFKPTEVGVSYGQMGPEGGYQVRYGQALPRQGQPTPPPQVSGQYRQQLDRNSEIQASGFYAPIPNMRDAYGANVRYVRRFEDGGMANANPADIAEQMTVGTLPEGQRPAGEVFRGIGRDVVRGAQYLPYDLLGAPVDIATMAMRPFGYNVEKPFLGSEYLIEKSRQAGIAQAPTGSATETATRIGMGFVNPAAVARQIPKGIAALEKGAETLGTGAVRAITGKQDITPEQIYQAMGDTKGIMSLGAPAIVKPKGGTFISGENSNFDTALNAMSDSLEGRRQAYRYVQGGEEDIKKINEVDNFFKSKFRNYYQKKLGSQNDPLREAFIRGDFNGADWFNAEEIARLREIATDPNTVGSVSRKQALDELNRKYDAWTDISAIFPDVNTLDEVNSFNMRTKSGQLETSPLGLYSERVLDKLKEQGANVRSNELAYSVDTRPVSEFDARAVNALKEKDLVYDVASTPTLQDRMVSIRDYLMTLNPNQIKNITFEDAIIGTERYHEALKNPAAKFTPEQLFEGREKLFQPSEKYQWSEIKTEDALRREGEAMNHCIGGDEYCRQLTTGIGKHFSLQDAQTGVPHTTISIYRSPFAPPNAKHVVVEQIKGNSNSAPTKYFNEVEKFLEDYEKRVGKIYITEDKRHIPPAFKGPEYTELPRGYEGNQYAKGGMVDKPLYDRAA